MAQHLRERPTVVGLARIAPCAVGDLDQLGEELPANTVSQVGELVNGEVPP